MSVIVVAVVGYLLGSVQSGLLVGRVLRGIDVREYGSGKTGFTNTLRTVGLAGALVVVALDILKGAAPVLIGRLVFDDSLASAAGGVGAVVGHTWPVFAGFRGGRGVATSFGAFAAVAPVAALLTLVIGGVVLGTTRYVSLMSITAMLAGFALLTVFVLAGWTDPEYELFGVAVTLSVELNHLGNFKRLLRGTEPKIGQGGVRRTPGRA
ncbi:MAG TPA: glycerol-3-phosphate 1-O-acyltransferase PlsY [Dehalococcoidia bacterium]|nr:glycerol-3-phosphate 1-O-acyltransferase PlsY [Dehalococcoidia bacterium]